MSIIQLYQKRKHKWTDASFNEQCALQHDSRGPGNLYPRSLWLMKKIAGVPEARKVQVSAVGLASSSVAVADLGGQHFCSVRLLRHCRRTWHGGMWFC